MLFLSFVLQALGTAVGFISIIKAAEDRGFTQLLLLGVTGVISDVNQPPRACNADTRSTTCTPQCLQLSFEARNICLLVFWPKRLMD